jgi:hypothetical protein
MSLSEPLPDEYLLRTGQRLWQQNDGRLWADIDATARVLMAGANPRAAWACNDNPDDDVWRALRRA